MDSTREITIQVNKSKLDKFGARKEGKNVFCHTEKEKTRATHPIH